MAVAILVTRYADNAPVVVSTEAIKTIERAAATPGSVTYPPPLVPQPPSVVMPVPEHSFIIFRDGSAFLEVRENQAALLMAMNS